MLGSADEDPSLGQLLRVLLARSAGSTESPDSARELAQLPHWVQPNALPNANLTELAMGILTDETEMQVAQDATQRLAAFGFGSVNNLSVYTKGDIDTVTAQYNCLEATPMATTLFMRRLHYSAQAYGPMAADQSLGATAASQPSEFAIGGAPHGLHVQFPPEVLEGLRTQCQAIERANKRARVNPHIGRDNEGSDDEEFDIQGALRKAGLVAGPSTSRRNITRQPRRLVRRHT